LNDYQLRRSATDIKTQSKFDIRRLAPGSAVIAFIDTPRTFSQRKNREQ